MMSFSSVRSASHPTNPHHPDNLKAFNLLEDSLPAIYNGLFATSGMCEKCHGYDPEGIASVTPFGEDVNVVDSWRSTMMANSAKDPYWRAKMRQEIMTNPQHEEEIGNFCTKCHAPLGRHSIEVTGVESYTFNHLLTDTAGLDGISCVACHQQSTFNLGNENSGNLHFETDPVAYGPFESPLVSPMALNSGYEPVYSEHISDAGICAGCHTLITGTVDLDGTSTGETFIEQATYHEWLNSIYGEDELNVTCQNCHMPDLGPKQPVQLAAGYDTPARAPYSLHTLVGANTLVLQMMKEYKDTLDIIATDEDYDATISATFDMLQQQSLDFDMELISRDAQSLKLKLVLENEAGHKFPSGYPARRLFVKLDVQDADQVSIFTSGEWDEDYYLVDEDAGFEAHYDTITSQDQVQIYEMVMADVNGDPTTILERADDYLKDNRLVPLGFNTEHAVYDTTLLVGSVLADENFNLSPLGMQGTGTDTLYFNIPLEGYNGPLFIEASTHYQSIPPKWTEELFPLDDPLINHFEEMYEGADKTPVLIDEVNLELGVYVGIEEMGLEAASRFWNDRGWIEYQTTGVGNVVVYDLGGRQVHNEAITSTNGSLRIQLSTGVYVIAFDDGKRQTTQKIYIE